MMKYNATSRSIAFQQNVSVFYQLLRDAHLPNLLTMSLDIKAAQNLAEVLQSSGGRYRLKAALHHIGDPASMYFNAWKRCATIPAS